MEILPLETVLRLTMLGHNSLYPPTRTSALTSTSTLISNLIRAMRMYWHYLRIIPGLPLLKKRPGRSHLCCRDCGRAMCAAPILRTIWHLLILLLLLQSLTPSPPALHLCHLLRVPRRREKRVGCQR